MKLRIVVKNKVVLFSLACAMALSADTIKSIEYKDVNKLSPEILNETLSMKVGEELNKDKLNDAVLKFYKYGYFDDITVSSENGILKFIFKEKPSISSVDIINCKKHVFTNRIVKNDEKYINNISIGKAVRASCSFPGLFAPCEFENYKFVDGGILDNVPVEELEKL